MQIWVTRWHLHETALHFLPFICGILPQAFYHALVFAGTGVLVPWIEPVFYLKCTFYECYFAVSVTTQLGVYVGGFGYRSIALLHGICICRVLLCPEGTLIFNHAVTLHYSVYRCVLLHPLPFYLPPLSSSQSPSAITTHSLPHTCMHNQSRALSILILEKIPFRRFRILTSFR